MSTVVVRLLSPHYVIDDRAPVFNPQKTVDYVEGFINREYCPDCFLVRDELVKTKSNEEGVYCPTCGLEIGRNFFEGSQSE